MRSSPGSQRWYSCDHRTSRRRFRLQPVAGTLLMMTAAVAPDQTAAACDVSGAAMQSEQMGRTGAWVTCQRLVCDAGDRETSGGPTTCATMDPEPRGTQRDRRHMRMAGFCGSCRECIFDWYGCEQGIAAVIAGVSGGSEMGLTCGLTQRTSFPSNWTRRRAVRCRFRMAGSSF